MNNLNLTNSEEIELKKIYFLSARRRKNSNFLENIDKLSDSLC